jgi:hypothetical protein
MLVNLFPATSRRPDTKYEQSSATAADVHKNGKLAIAQYLLRATYASYSKAYDI